MNEEEIREFGKRLETTIKCHYKNLHQFSNALGVDQCQAKRWTSGEFIPSGYSLFNICKLLDTSSDYLLFGEIN